MDIFELIPIEMTGMSAITAIVLFFFVIGFIEYSKMIKKELEVINECLKKHEDKIDDTHEGMNAVKTDVALLLQSVTRIEDLLKDKDRDRDKRRD